MYTEMWSEQTLLGKWCRWLAPYRIATNTLYKNIISVKHIGGDGGLVFKSRLTLVTSMDCSPPGSSIHGISQARILEWVAISFSRGSSRPRNWTPISCVSCIGRQILYHWSPFAHAFPSPWQVFLPNNHWLTFQTLTQQHLPLCNLLWYYASHSLTPTLAVFCLCS